MAEIREGIARIIHFAFEEHEDPIGSATRPENDAYWEHWKAEDGLKSEFAAADAVLARLATLAGRELRTTAPERSGLREWGSPHVNKLLDDVETLLARLTASEQAQPIAEWPEISAEDNDALLRVQAAVPVADLEALERIVQARIKRATTDLQRQIAEQGEALETALGQLEALTSASNKIVAASRRARALKQTERDDVA